MGGMCTKQTTIDEKVPDMTSGGLRGHSIVSPVRKSPDPETEPQPLSRAASKKHLEQQKVREKLDAVQQQREQQQVAGVQRLRERSQSMKLEKANSKKNIGRTGSSGIGRTASTDSSARADKVRTLNEKLKMGTSFEASENDKEKKEGGLLFSIAP
jgi:hypothetical protein